MLRRTICVRIFKRRGRREEGSRDPWISDLQTTGERGAAFLPQRFCTDGRRVGEVFFFFVFFLLELKRAPLPCGRPCILVYCCWYTRTCPYVRRSYAHNTSYDVRTTADVVRRTVPTTYYIYSIYSKAY